MKTATQQSDKAQQALWLAKHRAAHHAALETLRAPTCKLSGLQIWRKLRKLENIAHAGAEAYCNGETYAVPAWALTSGPEEYSFSEGGDKWEHFCLRVIKPQLLAIFRTIPKGFFVNGDARGHALKLDSEKTTVPQGMETDWGRDGILAAVIE